MRDAPAIPEPFSPRQRTVRRLCEVLHTLALAGWLGAVGMSAAVAAVVFPAMRELDPTLPGYAAFDGSHADLAAGFVQNRVFLLADVVQFGGASLGLATLLAMLVWGALPMKSLLNGVRLTIFCLALTLLSYWIFLLAPRMQTDLDAYWNAAAAGDTTAAQTAKASFDKDHPTASRLLGGIGLSVAASLVLTSLSATAAPGMVRTDSDR